MKNAATEAPAIYVACLASYNAGRLHGVWIDLTVLDTRDEVIDAIKEMLAESPVPGAEEWDIHDTEYLPRDLQGLGPMISFANAIESGAEREVLEHLLSDNVPPDCIEAEALDRYRGHFEDLSEFARDHMIEMASVDSLPPAVFSSIDWDEVAEQLRTERQFEYVKSASGGFHVLASDS